MKINKENIPVTMQSPGSIMRVHCNKQIPVRSKIILVRYGTITAIMQNRFVKRFIFVELSIHIFD
jgi:hypothetical protein